MNNPVHLVLLGRYSALCVSEIPLMDLSMNTRLLVAQNNLQIKLVYSYYYYLGNKAVTLIYY